MKFLNRITLSNSVAMWAAAVVCSVITAYVPRANAQGGTDLYNWTGFYIGGNVGATRSEFDFSGPAHQGNLFTELDVANQFYSTLEPTSFGVAETGLATFFGRPQGLNDASAIGGGQIGYNYQVGHFVFGVEGDFDRTAAHANYKFDAVEMPTQIIGENQIGETVGFTTFDATRRAEVNWQASLRGRIGYALGPFLIYGTGGIAWTEMDVFANDIGRTFFESILERGNVDAAQQFPIGRTLGTVTSSNISKDDAILTGWTGGGGIEWAISNTVSVGLEYRHTDFGDETFHFGSHNNLSLSSTTVGLINDQVTFKFNVMLSHLFGHQDYATTKMGTQPWMNGENVGIGYTASNRDDKSVKDKNIAVEEPFSWTGFYVGGHVGGAWNNFEFDGYDTDVDLFQQLTEFERRSPVVAPAQSINGGSGLRFATPGQDGGTEDTIIGGGQVGYNYQWRNFVFGVEGDMSGNPTDSQWTRFGSTEVADFFFSNVSGVTNFTSMREAETLWSASARGRLGWAQGRLLLYLTGGVAFADVEARSDDRAFTEFFSSPAIAPTAVDQIPINARFFGSIATHSRAKEENVQVGWTGGGGADWAFTKIASMGLEYRHNDFGDDSYNLNSGHRVISGGSTNVNISGDQVTLRLNFLLGSLH